MVSKKFGKDGPRLQRIWAGMRQRCNNPNHCKHPRYGARGIRVCDEWRRFKPFFEWAKANGYAPHLQIDRIDNDGNYSPENCRWVMQAQNIRNSTATTLDEEDVREIKRKLKSGEKQQSIADEFGVSNQLISCIHRGSLWSDIPSP
jgi:hypothetical protein